MIVQGTELTVGTRIKDPDTGLYTIPSEVVLRIEQPNGTLVEKRLSVGSVVQDLSDPTLFKATIDTSPAPGDWSYQFLAGGSVRKRKFRVRPLIGTYVPPPAPLAGEPPPPIQNQGYQLVFEDNFEVLDYGKWRNKIWYDGDPNPLWLADGFQEVVDGKLHQRSKRSFVWVNPGALPPYDTGVFPQNTMTTLGTFSFQYGYIEARMQWTDGKGVWPGFWLYSERHATNPDYPNVNGFCKLNGLPDEMCVAGEIDVFEGIGGPSFNPGPPPWPDNNTFFFGTVHRNSAHPAYGINDQVNPNNWQNAGVNLTEDFHTYAAKWTPDAVTWYLDNVELHTTPSFTSLKQPMFVLLSMWNPGWMFPISPAPDTPDTIEAVWDYVRIWQHA